MGQFRDYLSRKLHQSGRTQVDLAKYLGYNTSYISIMLNREDPPDPKNTGIHKKLDAFFGEPDGTFARHAMIDLYGKEYLGTILPPEEINSTIDNIRKKAGYLPHVKELLDELEKLPVADRTELMSFLVGVAKLDKDTLSKLAMFFRPFVDEAQRKLSKDGEKKDK